MTTDEVTLSKNRELINAMIVAGREERDAELADAYKNSEKERNNKKKNDEFNMIWHNRRKCVAKIGRNSRRALLYLLFFIYEK